MTAITDDTPATLAQHKVQAGDVVRHETGYRYTLGIIEPNVFYYTNTGAQLDDWGRWTVISRRATSTPLLHGHVRLSDGRVVDLTADKMLPFGMLEAEVRGAMIAHGGPYQMYGGGNGGGSLWAGWERPTWSVHMAYRVAPLPPAPKVETVTLDGWLSYDGLIYAQALLETMVAVRVTFTRIDGKPDPASYKLEAR